MGLVKCTSGFSYAPTPGAVRTIASGELLDESDPAVVARRALFTPTATEQLTSFAELGPDVPDGVSTALDLPGTYAQLGLGVASIRSGAPTVMGMGDSLTYNMSYPLIDESDWIFRASILSGGRFLHAGLHASPGATIQQIKATQLPLMIASKPAFCTVLAGQNNLATLSATDFTDLMSIYDQLGIAGITPILCTNVPSGSSPSANNFKLCEWVRDQARRRGLPLIDLWSILVDPATGVYKAGYSIDNVHLSEAGAAAVTPVFAAMMTKLIPNPTPLTLASNAGVTLLNSAPLLLADNGATPPVPSAWTVLSNYTAGAFDTVSEVPGRRWSITRGAGGDAALYTSFTVVAGHRIRVTLRLWADVKAVGGAWIVALYDGLTNRYLNLWGHADVAGDANVIAFETVVPTAVPNTSWTLRVTANGASGAVVKVAQVAVIDLTALGQGSVV
jgi:lysophospholipase L1-like esterase